MAPGKRSHSSLEDSKDPSVRKDQHLPSVTDSPLKKLKKLKAAMRQAKLQKLLRETFVLSSTEEFRQYVSEEVKRKEKNPNVDVIVQGTLLFKSEDIVQGSTPVVRLHLTSAKPTESLEELAGFKSQYKEMRSTVNELLMTVTIFDRTLPIDSLPSDGTVIKVVKSTRSLYKGVRCQLVADVEDIVAA